jgi:type I restriction enzyme, S subunit
MIADLKPYPKYKASSQAWLGDVPQHWSVVPNRALFAEVKDRNHPDEEMLSVTITRGIVRQKTLLEGSSKKDSSNLDKSAYKLLQPRDIAYNKMRAWQGAIGASALRGIISPAYVVMRLRKDDDVPSYFHHLYRTPQFAKEAERWSYGITSDMWSLRPEHFKMIYTPEPPPAEQAAIVRFLDWANGRLEQALRAKRQVITLLTEQKQAIISSLVTGKCEVRRVKGEDGHEISHFSPRPSHLMKPSGTPWLGEIPQHWEVLPLKRLVRIIDGDRGPEYPNAGDFVAAGIPFLSSKSIVNGKLNFDSVAFISAEKFQRLRQGKLLPGDLVITVRGTIGSCALFSGELHRAAFINAQMMILLSENAKLLNGHLLAITHSKYWIDRLTMNAYGSAQQQLSNQILAAMPIPFPPREEQEAILLGLTEGTTSLDKAIHHIEREIELLREYRTRLVADVVTGKLDVQEATARLPEEAAADIVDDDTNLNDETEPTDEEAAV